MLQRTIVLALLSGGLAAGQDVGLKVTPGFRVTVFADHTLANDIYALAFDEDGHVVVSGRGYVRRLLDTNGDGKADRAVDIAETKTGAMGLNFVQRDGEPRILMAAMDGKLQLWRRLVAPQSVPPDRYAFLDALPLPFPFSEHGGHAVRMGPDGMFYAIGGNDTPWSKGKFHDKVLLQPEAGGLVRFDLRYERYQPQIFAGGFRNPYDFDFTPLGDIITYDSDTERDFLLPWYMPTRVYHVQPGSNHGWRLPGYQRSLAKHDDYPDTVPMLANMGRGSPTGVCCYRHTQFPEHYRGGVFLLDWTFGKVAYLPLVPEGSSYRAAKPEVFLEATGQHGFAPTAARVAPDGSLFISIGGRGTRGAVYKIEYVGNGTEPIKAAPWPAHPLDQVLEAPQPLEAWSYAKWYRVLEEVKVDDLRRVLADEKATPARRIRAIEAIVAKGQTLEPHGQEQTRLKPVLQGAPEVVKARVAWALGLNKLNREHWLLLWDLVDRGDARASSAALQALWLNWVNNGPSEATKVVPPAPLLKSLDHADHRVRLAAGLLLDRLPPDQLAPILRTLHKDGASRQLITLALANVWGSEPRSPARWTTIQLAFERATNSVERLAVLRALTVFLGDWRLYEAGPELFAAYSVPGDVTTLAALRLEYGPTIRKAFTRFPTTDERENQELARLLAMLRDGAADTVKKLLTRITRTSHPTDDFHYLTVLARVRAPATPAETQQIADALLGLERKLAGRQLRIKQNWSARFSELTTHLLETYAGLDAMLATHPELVQPGHIAIVGQLPTGVQPAVAKRFMHVIQKDGEFPLTPEVVRLLAKLPEATYRPLFRERWQEYTARDAIMRILAMKPDAIDRERYLRTLDNAPPELALLCIEAIRKLPKDGSASSILPIVQRLHASFSEPKEAALRRQLVGLLAYQTEQTFTINEERTERPALESAYAPIVTWFEKAYPQDAKNLRLASVESEELLKNLPRVTWANGNAERGAKIYRDRGCLACHTGGSRIGPDLTGVTKRFNRTDLFTALVNPSRDVAPAYRVTNFDLKRGQRLSGIVIFESADGYIIQANATDTKRIATEEIEALRPSPKSLMPEGLLKDLRPDDWADLYAYLQTL